MSGYRFAFVLDFEADVTGIEAKRDCDVGVFSAIAQVVGNRPILLELDWNQ